MADRLYYYTSAADNLDASAVETDPSVAKPSNVKSDRLYKDAETLDLKTGTMTIVQPASIKINPESDTNSDSSYIIPEGYHDGTGKVYTGKLSEYTPGTATPEEVVNNKVFWVNGKRLVGTLDPGIIDTEGTATAQDLVEGKTAWVNKQKITGVIPKLPRRDRTLHAGESYVIPYGVSTGSDTISAATLESQTEGTAEKDDIISGKVAWVNGKEITGTLNIMEEIKERLASTNALQSQVLSGKMFYSSQYQEPVAGRMPNHSGEATKTIPIGQKFAIPEGYYDGFSYVTTQSLEDATQGSAKQSNILVAKTAWVNGQKITGTMPYIDPTEQELDSGIVYEIPEGYHTGRGKLITKSISSETKGTAEAKDIVDSKTAWVNGVKIIGSMPKNDPDSIELEPGESYYIPEGYHSGAGTVWTKDLREATAGTAEASNILDTKTAWVNGEKVTGTMPNNESEIITLLAGENFKIPEGYHDGQGKVKATPLAEQTVANASAGDIIAPRTAWVNGEKITGSLVLSGTAALNDVAEGCTFYNVDAKTKLTGTLKLTGDATEEDVLKGATFYNNNLKRKITGSLELTGTAVASNVLTGTSFYSTDPKVKIDGSMPNIGQVIQEITAGQTYIIPMGYHDGTGYIRTPGLAPQTPGTASEEDIVEGKTAWVNGEKIVGAMTLDGTATPDKVLTGYTYYASNPRQKIVGTMTKAATQLIELRAGQSWNVPIGYHDGESRVFATGLEDQTPGTATPDTILINRTAWVDGVQITGTMSSITSSTHYVDAEEEYIIPAGFHDGTGKVIGNSLASQTEATATPEDIVENKTAWVNGEKITGTIVPQSIQKIRITAGNDVTIPAGLYPNGVIIYALVPDILDLTGTDAWWEELDESLHPETSGYVDEEENTLVITAESL